MPVINLTPHAIVCNGAAFPASGQIARVSVGYVPVGDYFPALSGEPIPFVKGVYGPVTGLPVRTPDTLFLVSSMVRLACPGRKDLVSPADLVRDNAGTIVGCRSFEVN